MVRLAFDNVDEAAMSSPNGPLASVWRSRCCLAPQVPSLYLGWGMTTTVMTDFMGPSSLPFPAGHNHGDDVRPHIGSASLYPSQQNTTMAVVSHPMCPSLSINPNRAWLRYMAPYVSRIDGLRDRAVSPVGYRPWGVLLLCPPSSEPKRRYRIGHASVDGHGRVDDRCDSIE
jgi:hypothetical protein